MDKLSAQKMQRLAAQSAQLLKQAADELEEKDRVIEQYRQKEAAAGVYTAMQEKNISPPWAASEGDAVQHLMEMPPEKQAAVRMAVEMAAPQHPFAQLDSQQDDMVEGSGRVKGASSFEQFVYGNIS